LVRRTDEPVRVQPEPSGVDEGSGAAAGRPGSARGWTIDAGAFGAYVALAFFVTGGLCNHAERRVLPGVAGSDQLLLQWQLAHAAHALRHLSNPFFTTDLNAPAGVNLAANANILGLGLPLAPVTLIAGPAVAYAVLATASLALTAAAWFWVLSRPLGLNRVAAFVGGLLGGFAPPLIAESNGHQHIVAQFLVPYIAWRVASLVKSRRPLRDGVILGVLIGYQGLIGEEVLLLLAIGLAVFVTAYAIQRPRTARVAATRFLCGLGVSAVVALGILAVPLRYQFAGPQRFSGNPVDPQAFPADLLSYIGIPQRAIGGWMGDWVGGWSAGSFPTLGLPLLIVLVAFGWPLRRHAVFTSTVAVAAVFAMLSLGVQVRLGGEPTGIPGPWRLVAHAPVFEWVLPWRVGHLAATASAVALAVIVDRAIIHWRGGARLAPVLVAFTTAVGLVTLAPEPLQTEPAPAIPRFITQKHWREYVPPGRSLMTAPVPSHTSFDAMRWSAAAGVDFAIPGGYFLGPSADGSKTLFGAPHVWTRQMLDTVVGTGKVWQPAAGERDQFLRDLEYWRVSVVVLAPHQTNGPALQNTLEGFLGPAQPVEDVLIWDVRRLVSPG
jgi:hypothetical protein